MQNYQSGLLSAGNTLPLYDQPLCEELLLKFLL